MKSIPSCGFEGLNWRTLYVKGVLNLRQLYRCIFRQLSSNIDTWNLSKMKLMSIIFCVKRSSVEWTILENRDSQKTTFSTLLNFGIIMRDILSALWSVIVAKSSVPAQAEWCPVLASLMRFRKPGQEFANRRCKKPTELHKYEGKNMQNPKSWLYKLKLLNFTVRVVVALQNWIQKLMKLIGNDFDESSTKNVTNWQKHREELGQRGQPSRQEIDISQTKKQTFTFCRVSHWKSFLLQQLLLKTLTFAIGTFETFLSCSSLITLK